MATRTICICDHCGREFGVQADTICLSVGDYTVEFGLEDIIHNEHDLYSSEYHICWPCITDALRKFMEKENSR